MKPEQLSNADYNPMVSENQANLDLLTLKSQDKPVAVMVADTQDPGTLKPNLVADKQTVGAPAKDAVLPDKFATDEKFWRAWLPWVGDRLDVKAADGKNLGVIEQDYWSATPTFDMKDPSGKVIAHARTEIFSWGTTNDVYDGNNHLIGTFKKEVMNSFWAKATSLGTQNKYSVLDANGKEIGTSEKSGYWTTSFTIKDQAGQPIATIHRPMTITNWGCDWWDVTVNKPGAIDPRMLAMLTAFKTVGDNVKESDSSSSSSSKKKK